VSIFLRLAADKLDHDDILIVDGTHRVGLLPDAKDLLE